MENQAHHHENPDVKSIGFFKSRWFNLSLKIFISLIAALVIFQAGMFVGFRKASFSFGWGDNYHRNFGGPADGFMRGFAGKDMVNGHGVAGMIVSVDQNHLVIKGVDNIEKIVIVSERTSIMKGRGGLKLSELGPGDKVVVIGRPGNDGTVNAEMIRIFDGPPPPPNLPMMPPLNR